MRPIIKFLDYDSPHDTDILQEYFVPIERFVDFVNGLRNIIKEEIVNLLSVTVRYMPADRESFLPYVRQDSFALVLYINQGVDTDSIQKAVRWTQKIVDLALRLDGTYYLPYQRYPSREQLLQAYPSFKIFIDRKYFYDPAGTFMNQWFQYYSGDRQAVYAQ